MGKVNFRLPDDIEQQLRATAKARNQYFSAYLRDLIMGDPTAKIELSRDEIELKIETLYNDFISRLDNLTNAILSLQSALNTHNNNLVLTSKVQECIAKHFLISITNDVPKVETVIYNAYNDKDVQELKKKLLKGSDKNDDRHDSHRRQF